MGEARNEPAPASMRVALYYNNRDVRVTEMATPKIGSEELLVRIKASGICGTDVMEWYRIKRVPRVLGHEITGEIVARGAAVREFFVGDRVFVSHHVPCGECRYCRDGHESVCDTLRRTHFDPGGFAEYVRVPEINVRLGTFRLPAEISFEEGSFIEPLGCVVRGQRLAGFKPGKSVLIIGSGMSGLLHVQLARARGAAFVAATDINDYRLRAAERCGAHAALNAAEEIPARLKELNQGRLADLVIVCAGAPAPIRQAIQSVERGGVVLLFAPTAEDVEVSFPIYELWRNEVTITTSYAASPRDLVEATELIRAGRVKVGQMITHRLGLSEIGLGFQLVTEAKDSIKVIVNPGMG
jgi:L-iditol 2-dehydrogenase